MSLPAVGLLCLVIAPQDSATAPQSLPAWIETLDRLKFYGDFRLRAENDFELDDQRSRDRRRIRLRFGVNYDMSDEVLFGARLVTGDKDDPNSTHVTLGSGFDDVEINLDRAFMTYRPHWVADSYVTAGKFSNPFYRNPVYAELAWDLDIQPEGAIAGHTSYDVAGLRELMVTVGAYDLQEERNASDANMLVGELRGGIALGSTATGTPATSYTHYGDVTPGGSTTLVAENQGNAVIDTSGDGVPDEFVSDFGIWHTVLGVNYSGASAPLAFGAEYIKNTRAEIDQDQGWALGCAWGSTAKQGEWRVYYQWQVVEQDAVFSSLAQDDFLFSTNHRSHLFGVNYQLTDDIGLHLWGLVSARDQTFNTPTTDSDDDQWRVRLDLNVKL